jgi:hypothetical protein
MPNLDEIIEGLTILKKYVKGQEWISAEHDMIYGPPTEGVISDEDAKRLDDLGWHKEDGDSWAAFT